MADARWLAGGPLDRQHLRFRQLELNAQVVRFPSGQEPQFGGQAVYLMRIFGHRWRPCCRAAAGEHARRRAAFGGRCAQGRARRLCRGNAQAIDQGVYMIPDRLLARKVISYSTFGNARQVNHPFTPLLSPQDFAGLDLSQNRLVRSPEALLERLDNGTCQGCHQSGATAGFHFIGLDDKFTSPLNRIEVGISPHFHAELPRRDAYVAAVATGREPNRFRPLSFAPPADWKDDGGIAYAEADLAQPCLTPEDAARFGDNWQCGAGTVCTPLATTDKTRIALAQCLPPPDTEMYSGLPCLQGQVSSSSGAAVQGPVSADQFAAFAAEGVGRRLHMPAAAHRRSRRARLPQMQREGPQLRLVQARRRTAAGDLRPDRRQGVRHLRGTGKFDECLAGAVQRGNRASCSADHFCRDDYICQAFPPDTPGVEQDQRRRLLLADLFPVPDAHRQPHDAMEEPRARRLPVGGGGRRRGAVVSAARPVRATFSPSCCSSSAGRPRRRPTTSSPSSTIRRSSPRSKARATALPACSASRAQATSRRSTASRRPTRRSSRSLAPTSPRCAPR